MRHLRVSLAILIAGMLAQNAWKSFPLGLQGYAWNVGMALLCAGLLAILALSFRSPEVTVVTALVGGFQLQTAGCSLWFMIDPWPTGEELCSAGLHAPVALIALYVAIVAAPFVVRWCCGNDPKR